MSTATSKNANALLFGALIGLAAGMLFAPKSGRENRERLAREYGKTKEHLHKSSQELMSKAKDTTNKLKRKTDEATDRMQDNFDQNNSPMV
jgi:gas vesicle protein